MSHPMLPISHPPFPYATPHATPHAFPSLTGCFRIVSLYPHLFFLRSFPTSLPHTFPQMPLNPGICSTNELNELSRSPGFNPFPTPFPRCHTPCLPYISGHLFPRRCAADSRASLPLAPRISSTIATPAQAERATSISSSGKRQTPISPTCRTPLFPTSQNVILFSHASPPQCVRAHSSPTPQRPRPPTRLKRKNIRRYIGRVGCDI